ncbi:MAG TPA: hypothetical protein VIX12_08865 [Candidatus Binataceae bacterium]
MPVSIRTARGIYSIKSAGPLEDAGDSVIVTLSLERSDGIERVAFRCAVARGLIGAGRISADDLTVRLASWIEREFEMAREAALKSIRSEKKLYEFSFDVSHPGPFAV